ncbi:MAG TPA: flagellar hook-length control protein FliK, partial [Myxococcaceae bacterium]|nr:flagellar hook-length control protein FliK [Myxococcaceae bacterium]
SDVAFAARRARVAGDPRALADLLVQRSRGVPSEAPALLGEAAELLAGAGEPLRAAEALDALLRLRPDDVPALLARAELAAEAGGPQAAQPYDRRAIAAGGDTLDTAQRVRLQLRLGHASLAQGALQDAAGALEEVVALDPDGERGRQALFLLGEVYSRRPDAAGAFRTALRLARRSGPEEAEALYRRAAGLVESPAEALEALLPLSELRPADASVVDRAIAGLRQAGRNTELEALLDRAARASGGSRAAALLLEAAGFARARGNAERELVALEGAAGAEPTNVAALEGLAGLYRARGDGQALARTLESLISQRPLDEASARLRVEAARALSAADEPERVRALVQPVVDAGPSPSYAEALELLEPLLSGAPLAHALAVAARADLQQGAARAALLFEAARLAHEAGDASRAAAYARSSVATEPTAESLLLLASLMRETGEMATAAAALTQAAQRAPEAERPGLLLQAADAWEAAGDPGEARTLLERLAEGAPELLPPGDWASRLLRLGSVEAAARYGFAPLLAQGATAEALAVAEAIGDRGLVRSALWAAASSTPEPEGVRRLGALVLADGTSDERLRAARLAEMVRAQDLASPLYRAVLLTPAAPGETSGDQGAPRVEALARLVALGEGDAVLWEVLEGLEPDAPSALVDALAVYARGRRGSERERALRSLAARVPSLSAPLWSELFQRARDEDRLDDAGTALSGWLEATGDPAQRAALWTQLGDLALHLGQADRAREAYRQAAAEDPAAAAPLPKLLALTAPDAEPARFVEIAERLEALAGPASLAEFRPGLATAYAQLGQTEDAYRALGELPQTSALIAQRAALAEALGRQEESFALREQLVQSPVERAALGLEAARAGFADRAAQLLAGAEAELPVDAHREVAERLAASDAGAPIAARLWPSLLVESSLDVLGWTAYAEALRRIGRAEAAARAEAFALAASGELPLSDPPRSVAPVQRPRTVSTYPLPQGALAVDASTMPELHAALAQALESLGAPEVVVYLDPAGGPEAWMAGGQAVVLGAGALSYFGVAELTFLLALALLLGDEGAALASPGPVEGLARVAAAAYTAVPAPLAAARVLVLLDGVVRGADVEGLDVASVLAASTAFRAVVQRAVALV